MKCYDTCAAMRNWRNFVPEAGDDVGLVPTMGALHDGHRALIRRARATCNHVVVSIFVNPLQFGPREDYGQYPRNREQDLATCQEEDVDVVFAPSVPEMYPSDFSTHVEVVSHLTRVLEGSSRPGHFRGVSTVLTKLFCLAAPTKSYFGQKDYQQALLVETMVRDLNIPTEIVLVPTVREPDGLALSSRNRYLSPSDRQAALVLYRSLEAGRRHILHGVRDPGQVERHMQQIVGREPRAHLEYLVVRSAVSLQLRKPLRGQVVMLGALRIGGVRLIDNLLVRVPESEGT